MTFLLKENFAEEKVNFSLGEEPKGEEGPTVLELALANEIDLNHSCGGFGTCGTCMVKVESDLSDLSPRNSIEEEMAEDRGFESNERLGCQTVACPGLIVRIT